MTAQSGTEREQKQTEHKESLKGALVEVLQKSVPHAEVNPAEVKPPQKAEEKKPFEVSEDTLRKVFKGES